MTMKDQLLQKIKNNEETAAIIGLGYVGLPLAVLFAKKGVRVLGFDKSPERVAMVNEGRNYIGDVKDDELQNAVKQKKLQATGDFSKLAECDVIIVCVPTPLDRFKKPDMSYIESAALEIARNMKRGILISLESTTYPTTTEGLMLPLLEEHSAYRHGEDYWICFSPERVDPGNRTFNTENTVKVIGGLGAKATEIAMAFYGKAISSLHPVSSPAVAEMVKILENVYRLVNISLINEMALLCGKMDIDIWEVIEAAKTKPFGFQPFYPGPGIGGHCIPLDPFYLEYIARKYNFDLTMIHTAGHIDNLMPHRMLIKINTALNRQKKSINGARVLFMGVAYKPDIADERESPALKIMDEVSKKQGEVLYHDPHVTAVETPEGRRFQSVELTDDLVRDVDCVVFATNHSDFDVRSIVEKAKLVVDLRNATHGIDYREKIYKL